MKLSWRSSETWNKFERSFVNNVLAPWKPHTSLFGPWLQWRHLEPGGPGFVILQELGSGISFWNSVWNSVWTVAWWRFSAFLPSDHKVMPVPTPSVLVPVERAPPPPDTLHTHTTFDFFLDFFDVVVLSWEFIFFLHTYSTAYCTYPVQYSGTKSRRYSCNNNETTLHFTINTIKN